MDQNNNIEETNNSTPAKNTRARTRLLYPELSLPSVNSDDEENPQYTISSNLQVPNSFNEESRVSYVSSILGEDPLSQKLKDAIECSKCYHFSSETCYQDRSNNLFCNDCVPRDPTDKEKILQDNLEEELGTPKYVRNIAVEKVRF